MQTQVPGTGQGVQTAPRTSPQASYPETIRQMFGGISKSYDLANSVLSLGIHHLWKKKLVEVSGVRGRAAKVLDCATGTGDLAFLFESVMAKEGEIVGTDFCEPMLAVAQAKAHQRNSRAKFEIQDVMNLKYDSQSFDVASISFGIRNVQNTKQALAELGRVVRPGGKVLVLEFGQPRVWLMGALYQFYSSRVLPTVGGWISGQRQAYQYLQTSSAAYPCGEKFLDIARETGCFKHLSYIPFQTGIAYLYQLER